MDLETLRGLRHLPGDLEARRWEFSPGDSGRYRAMEATWYLVVYARACDADSDDLPWRPTIRSTIVRISARGDSWHQAQTRAIAEMRRIDTRRRIGS